MSAILPHTNIDSDAKLARHFMPHQLHWIQAEDATHAQRIHLEQQRLALDQSRNQDSLDSLFWEWTKRPEIQARLFPHRDPDQIRRDTIRLIDRELLGIQHPDGPISRPDPDPATLI